MSKRKKRFCVIGLSQFGHELALALARECEVLALDANQALVDGIADSVHRAFCLDARDFHSLASVVSEEFNGAVVCMGHSMEASILAVLHLKKIGVRRVHAKAMNRDHAQILQAIGADNIIFPEQETAQRFAVQVVNPNLLDFVPLTDDYSVVEVMPPEAFYGHSLAELDLRRRFAVFVIAVKEYVPSRMVFLPGPEFVVKPSDTLIVIGQKKGLEALQHAPAPDFAKIEEPPAAASEGADGA
ncbi:MAG: TrkA family potassium uptake protein [Planctomycetota bacterium]